MRAQIRWGVPLSHTGQRGGRAGYGACRVGTRWDSGRRALGEPQGSPVTNQEEVNVPERKLWPCAHCMSVHTPWRARGTGEGSSSGPAFLGTTFKCICL